MDRRTHAQPPAATHARTDSVDRAGGRYGRLTLPTLLKLQPHYPNATKTIASPPPSSPPAPSPIKTLTPRALCAPGTGSLFGNFATSLLLCPVQASPATGTSERGGVHDLGSPLGSAEEGN
ncbi:hypothetical protein V501_05749 [Pseudogymnoascus sp. VKM F-4519 (FW-2642)]|nr:hypothetical protein V501_05749 [Pseudogymnoascus sp. VKM F-4519 (FW-2642)]